MATRILLKLFVVLILVSCGSSSRNNQRNEKTTQPVPLDQPEIANDLKPSSLMTLPQTQDGGFVLSPGFYEAEFKTFCLQPGTPDPRPNDAYLQAPLRGYRKEIIQTILTNSRNKPHLDQKNVQLLLWSTVSGSNYNKLSSAVKMTASELLSSKQIFELKGGVPGLVKTVAANVPSIGGNNDINRLFEAGASSYEAFERLAVLREPAQVNRAGVSSDQWYKQNENYYVRYFPVSYQKVKIQVFMPAVSSDSSGKVNGEYVVFDPTGWQAIPANSNAQRLGIGGPVIDIIRDVIIINKGVVNPKRQEPKAPAPKGPKGV